MQTWTYLLVTFGCKVNQYETQALREAWNACGGKECSQAQLADLICVNSCAVTSKGERDARQALSRLKRLAPQAKLVLTGCAADLYSAYQPLRHNDLVTPTLIVGQDEKARLLDPLWLLEATGLQASVKNVSTAKRSDTYPPFEIHAYTRSRPVLKVQDGCAHRCTYCIVPSMRKHSCSRPPHEVAEEARRLFRAGHVEGILSGINLHEYGRTLSDTKDFWDLIAFLEDELATEFFGRARLRISSVEPSQLTERGLATLAGSRLICPHLHISLQHVNQDILKRMGRGHYTAQTLQKAVQSIRSFWPLFGLGCDLISGFPGESEEAHQELLAYLTDLPFTYGHVFPYSPRPGTPAATFPEQVPEKVKIRRAAELREVLSLKKEAFCRMLLAQKIPLTVALEGRKILPQKGLSQYYVSCQLTQPKAPEKLLRALPRAITANGLLVEEQGA